MPQHTINPDCPCTYSCSRHGDCSACKAYHRKTGSLTACERISKK